MKTSFISALTYLTLFLGSGCSSGNKHTSDFFEIQLDGNKSVFQQNQKTSISIKNKKNLTVESVSYTIDGENLPVTNHKIALNMPKLGSKTIKATINYNGTSGEIIKEIKLLAPEAPQLYTYEIINQYPHDKNAFTQGLEFYKDTLYESTGVKGKSTLRKTNFKTGEILKQINLENTYFGEGITILNDKIYMLTWQSGIGFVYDVHDFKKIDSFTYGASKEGWGLTNDGEKLYKSDGTEKIWLLNPKTLVEESYIETVTNKSVFNKANELEFVNGKVYANVWQKESMMIIDALSGAIEGVVNFGGLKEKVTQSKNLDVLNGVAYHKERKTFFVTGKNWDKLFEVKIIQKK